MTMPSEENIRAMFPTPPGFGKRVYMIDRAIAEELARALEVFAFFLDGTNSLQDSWETIYNDRVQDWIDCSDIEVARAALTRYNGIDNPALSV